jgi:4-amino-4-deoxy-L-arabinose transferase-like glycosyltransferase
MTDRLRPLAKIAFSPKLSGRLLWSGLVALILAVRGLVPPRDLEAGGLLAIRDAALSLSHWLMFLLVAVALGLWLQRRISPPDMQDLEKLLYGFALGLGLLAYLVLGLGLAGVMYPALIAGVTVGSAFLAAPSMGQLFAHLASGCRSLQVWLKSGKALERISLVVTGLIALLALIHTLGPAWDYDGLMYHLPGPAIFLANHRIQPNLDIWYANGPFAVEMLFTFGLAHGDAIFAKLIHYAFGWLYVAAAVMAAKRWLGEREAWLSSVVLLGMPTLPIWAAFAYVDLGWASFEFLGVCAAVRWWQTRSERWLILAGLLTGVAMGTKYTGLAGFAALACLVALLSWRQGLAHLLRSSSIFAGIALLIASPWYLKNWLWFGNPVYPLYFGGPGWDAERLSVYMAYLRSFGAGRDLSDWLLLPWNIYARNAQFGAVMNQIDVPSLLFPVLLFYPLRRGPKPITLLLGFAAGRSILWALGSQQTRFLLPVFPALALATGHLIHRLIRPGPRRMPWHIFLPSLAVALSGLTLFYQLVVLFKVAPHLPAAGWESSHQFLMRIVRDYPAVDFVNRNLPDDSRVLQLGDGRTFYCPTKCVPDPDHFRWAAQINRSSSAAELASWMRGQGFTHLRVSWEDIDFLLQHDPTSTMLDAVHHLSDWMNSGCLHEIYADDWDTLVEVACP